jgi:hypothetical protein
LKDSTFVVGLLARALWHGQAVAWSPVVVGGNESSFDLHIHIHQVLNLLLEKSVFLLSRGEVVLARCKAIMFVCYQSGVICCSGFIDIQIKVKKTNIHKHMSLMDDAW